MDATLPLFFSFLTLKMVASVPPEACFQNFRWDDCGQPPEPVMYYWKSGSRCEVGLWRGCLPNLNMFKDEYECVSTCMFTARAQPEDYHGLFKEDDIIPNSDSEELTTVGNDTLYDSTTTVAGEESSENTTDGDSENDNTDATTPGGGDSGSETNDDATGGPGEEGGGDASTDPPADAR